MRVLVCWVVMASAAAADDREHPARPRVSLGGMVSVAKERVLTGVLGGEARIELWDRTWLTGAFGVGEADYLYPDNEGQRASSAYEARLGGVHLACGEDATGCWGVAGSVGFVHQRITFDDPFDTTMHTEIRDLGFGEVRGVGRLQLGILAIEAALGVRICTTLHREHVEGGTSSGLVAGLGLHVTF